MFFSVCVCVCVCVCAQEFARLISRNWLEIEAQVSPGHVPDYVPQIYLDANISKTVPDRGCSVPMDH